MAAGFVHLFSTAHDVEIARLQTALLKHGLGLRLYEHMGPLCEALAVPQASGEPQLVMLADASSHAWRAARALRQVSPDVHVVALLSTVDAQVVQTAMRHGVDICWPRDVPAQLLAGAVVRLLRCRVAAPVRQVRVETSVPPRWRLASGAWVVQTPRGASVTLTTAERALVLALCAAPGRRLDHAQLMQAIDGGCPAGGRGLPGQSPTHYARSDARRLSVLVSRLRQKFAATGAEIPIRSLRRMGYEISVEFAGQPEAREDQSESKEPCSQAGAVSLAARAPGGELHAVAAEPVLAASLVEP